MTYEAARAMITSVARTCRGPQVLSDEVQQKHRVAFHALWHAGNARDLVKYVRDLEVELNKDHAPLRSADEVLNRATQLIFAFHENCGYDFNQIILKTPWDGKTYPYTCPKCGTKGEFQSPLIELTRS